MDRSTPAGSAPRQKDEDTRTNRTRETRDALEVREAVVDHGHARALGLVPLLPLSALLLVLLDRALAEDRPPDRQLARLVPAVDRRVDGVEGSEAQPWTLS